MSPITKMWVVRSLVITEIAAFPVVIWLCCRAYGGMRTMDAAVLVSSLTYQLYALPWEIRRNFKAKAVNKVSYGMAFVGTASYTFSTVRALIQPDWVDVGSRWWGMIGSLVIAGQIIVYDRVRLSWDMPFLIRPAFDLLEHPDLAAHTTSWWCKGCIKVSGLAWPLTLEVRCEECGGPVHVIEQLEWRLHMDPEEKGTPLVFQSRCARCGLEVLKRSPGPFPLGSTFWLWSQKHGWREVGWDYYKEVTGTQSSYVAYRDSIGLVVRPNATPKHLAPGRDDVKLLNIRAGALH